MPHGHCQSPERHPVFERVHHDGERYGAYQSKAGKESYTEVVHEYSAGETSDI